MFKSGKRRMNNRRESLGVGCDDGCGTGNHASRSFHQLCKIKISENGISEWLEKNGGRGGDLV